jgi:uncharacterized protein (DUF58 family)
LGWLCLAVSALCGGVWWAWGWVEMLVLASFGGIVFAGAIIVSLGNTGFGASIALTSTRISEGDSAGVIITVTNDSLAPTVRARARIAIGDQYESFAIAPLAPGQKKETTLTFTAPIRSVLSVGPLLVRKGDPFGLVRRELTLTKTLTLYVHPRTQHLQPIDAGIIRDLEGNATQDIVDDDLSFYGLRDYQPGDDVRNIAWLSTAKAQHLMVRQFQATRKTTTSLCFDTHAEDYRSRKEFELAVSTHASIGVQCLLQERPLIAHAGLSSAPATSPMKFLDACSAIAADDDNPADSVGYAVRHAPDSSFYVFTVGALKSIDLIKSRMAEIPAGATCLVIRVEPTQPRSIRRFDGFSMASIPALSDLPLVMEVMA